MVDFIAGVVGLIFIVMLVLFVVSTVKFKQKNKQEGKKLLKFAGISFAVIIVLSLISNAIEKPADSAKDDKVTVSVDDKEKALEDEKKAKEEEKKAKIEEERKANEAKQQGEDESKLKEEQAAKAEKEAKEKAEANVKQKEETKLDKEPGKPAYIIEGEANAELYPAKPAAMLYDKTESKFKGMNYYFKGELVGVKKLERLFGNMEDALLIKNDKGYVMPVFSPYEIDATVGQTLEAWGPLSGDGYAASDLGVNNVVGMTGAMNATQISVHND
ncbi:pilin [Lysinibacillus sphaericus]|uniref:pilin n=1 Tax=Lysinibacillus sphaericus TaxID=1421 RepID=UPI003F79C16F